MADNAQYQGFAKKLGKMHLKFDKLVENRNIVSSNKNKFLAKNEGDVGKMVCFFLLCAAVLLLDYKINTEVLFWFSELINFSVHVIAILFLIIDATVSILHSGVFAKDLWGKQKAQKQWRIVLWSLAALKAFSFLIFAHIVKTGTFEGIGLMTAIQIGLLILVYLVLDFAGEGLYFMGVRMKFAFLENVWFENPKALSLKIKQELLKIKNIVFEGNAANFNNFLSMFNIKHIYQIHADNDKSANAYYNDSFTNSTNSNNYSIQSNTQNTSVANNNN